MRLIDADKLKDTLLEYNYTTEHNQIFRYINEQPTAYDINEVVEELEEEKINRTNKNVPYLILKKSSLRRAFLFLS